MGQKTWKMPAVILGTGFILALFAGILSPAERGGQTKPYEETVFDETEEPADGVILPSMENCTEIQAGILKRLYEAMEAGDLPGAASCMENHKEEIAALLEETFDGERFLYDGGSLREVSDGRGIVLTAPSTLFYGNFKNGRPEGTATALQGIVLEEPRYDYSIGTWADGKMNGYGTAGYTYYEGAGEQDGLRVEKSGLFQDDKMNGEVRYTSINHLGDSATWILTAENGTTKIDGKWKRREAKKEYILPAENDASHGYVLKDADLDAEIWQNRILWQQNP